VTARQPSAKASSRAAESERGKSCAHSPEGLSPHRALPSHSTLRLLPAPAFPPLPQHHNTSFLVRSAPEACQGKAERGQAGLSGRASLPKHSSQGLMYGPQRSPGQAHKGSTDAVAAGHPKEGELLPSCPGGARAPGTDMVSTAAPLSYLLA